MDALSTLQKLWDQVQDDRLKELYLTLRTQILDLKEENVRLREQNLALQTQANKKPELKYDGKMYWDESATVRDGPYCPTCADNDHKMIRLSERERGWFCHVCKHYIETKPEPPQDPYRPMIRSGWAG